MSAHWKLEDLPPDLRAQAEAKLRSAGEPSASLAIKDEQPCVELNECKPKRKDGPNENEKRFNRIVLNGQGKYEAVTFHLPGGSRYTPDYVVWMSSLRMVVYEVKDGRHRLPSEGRALTAWREAAAAFPRVLFMWYAWNGHEYERKHAK